MDFKIKSIRHNAIMNGFLSVMQIIFPLITFPYISRVLGAEANGRISFSMSLVNYFALFATLGMTTYGIRACAKVREDKTKLSKTVHELLMINTVTTSIVYIALIAAISFVPRLKIETKLILINSLTLVLNVAGMNWLYSAIEQYDYITIRSIIFKLISLVLMFICVHKPEDLYIYAAINVFATVGPNILNIIYSRRFIEYRKIGDYNLKQHIKPTLMLFVSSLAINVYTNLDNVMLGFITDDYQVGIYNASVKIRSTVSALITSLGAVLLPRLSNYVQNKQNGNYYKILKKSFAFTSMASLSLALYFFLFAKEGILLLSGEGYLDSVVPMKILIWLIIITGLSNIFGVQILIPNNQENKYMISVICGAVADFILNLFLIPKYAAIGAAVATLFAELTQFVIQIFFLRKELKNFIEIKVIIKVLLACALAFCAVLPIKMLVTLSPFFMLAVTAVVYYAVFAIALWIMKFEFLTEMVEQFTKGKIKR